MNIEQLRYFLSVAHHRNFTEAAREFYITQPAITHQISALEKELGTSLFTRTTRSVTLTEAGRLYLEYARRMLAQQESALQNLKLLKEASAPHLRIGYLNAPCRHFLPQILADYRRRYPQVEIDMVRSHASGLMQLAEQQPFDFIFSVNYDLARLSGYTCKKLTTDYYCLVCTKDSHYALDPTIDYKELSNETFLFLSRDSGTYMYKQGTQILRDLGVTPAAIKEYPELEDVLFAAQCKLGLTILPLHVREYLCGDLAFIPISQANLNIDMGVAWQARSDNPAAGWLLELLNFYLVEQPELF